MIDILIRYLLSTKFAYFNPLLEKYSPYTIPCNINRSNRSNFSFLSARFQVPSPRDLPRSPLSISPPSIGRDNRFETHPRNLCAITRGPEPDRYRRSTKRRRAADRGEIHEERDTPHNRGAKILHSRRIA